MFRHFRRRPPALTSAAFCALWFFLVLAAPLAQASRGADADDDQQRLQASTATSLRYSDTSVRDGATRLLLNADKFEFAHTTVWNRIASPWDGVPVNASARPRAGRYPSLLDLGVLLRS